jgi:hypothetical protein
MAKSAPAVRFFSGYNSRGQRAEAAMRADGVLFARCCAWNGRGYAFEKWWEYKDPSWITEIENRYSGEKIKLERPLLGFGFSRLEEYPELAIPRVRLPLPEIA